MDEQEKAALEIRLRKLERVVTGQAAMIACLTGLLHRRGGLTAEEAVLVVTASISFPPGLTPEKITAWLLEQAKKFKD